MRTISDITGKIYYDEDCVHYRNPIQSAYMKAWGAELVDLFVDGHYKWVYVFTKEDHRKYIDKWNQRKKELGMQ